MTSFIWRRVSRLNDSLGIIHFHWQCRVTTKNHSVALQITRLQLLRRLYVMTCARDTLLLYMWRSLLHYHIVFNYLTSTALCNKSDITAKIAAYIWLLFLTQFFVTCWNEPTFVMLVIYLPGAVYSLSCCWYVWIFSCSRILNSGITKACHLSYA